MKHMKAFIMAALVLLAIAGVAAAADTVDVRSQVMTLDNSVPKDTVIATIGPAEWAGLYFDFDKNSGTETFKFTFVSADKVNITYNTTPLKVDADARILGTFNIIGFFAEEYVALTDKDNNVNANKIAKLIYDGDDKYTMKTGQALDLGAGYAVIPKQIDVDGNKVWIELQKDGTTIDNTIINASNAAERNWELKKDVLDEDDVVVFKVHVNQVFQGSVDSLVEIEGAWLVDYQNAFEVKDDTNYGKFDCDSADSGLLSYVAENVTLSKDKSTLLGNGIYIETGSKYETNHQFMLVKKYTEPGTYEVRSTVLKVGNDVANIDYKSFAAFYYDIDQDIWTENLSIDFTGVDKIEEKDLVYTSEYKKVDFEESNITKKFSDGYPVVGLFGSAYVPLMDKDGNVVPEKLTKLIIDSDDKYTVKTGQVLDLGSGYTVIPKQIDVDGNKVWIELQKDGTTVDDTIINGSDEKLWTLKKDVLDEDDVVVLQVYVNQVFQGSVDSLVEIQGLWLSDYENAFELKEDDSFGKLDFDGTNGKTLRFVSNTNIVLSKDKDFTLGGFNNSILKIKTNNPDPGADLSYYLYVEKILGGNVTPPTTPTPTAEPTVAPTTAPATPTVQPSASAAPTAPPTAPPEDSFLSKYGLYILVIVIIVVIVAAGVAYAKKTGKI